MLPRTCQTCGDKYYLSQAHDCAPKLLSRITELQQTIFDWEDAYDELEKRLQDVEADKSKKEVELSKLQKEYQ